MDGITVMALRLVLAGLLGAMVGYEREIHEHPAGLRTHILVCMGSALITLVSVSFMPPYGDPGRIAAQIVSGIGFLGAGTILRQGNIVRGLTTAASLWTVAGIGMAVGVGGPVYPALATIATLIVFITLSALRRFEPSLVRKREHVLYLEVPAGKLQGFGDVLNALLDMGISIESVRSLERPEEDKRAFKLKVLLPNTVKPDAVIGSLVNQTDVDRFEWT